MIYLSLHTNTRIFHSYLSLYSLIAIYDSVRKLIYLLKKAGWQKIAQKGSHAQYRHQVRKGKITILLHRLGNTISLATERRILKQAGLLI
ncbi:type II toxin-antitoxin system HicA family toxin [Phascolarctobacterium succinatutens]|uniref:type II toxin-antitoxin system HicA family toxin n=1 Tax=Phascolarctobacterium succinatutens TaxID=626940 RepID=UPI003C6DFC13